MSKLADSLSKAFGLNDGDCPSCKSCVYFAASRQWDSRDNRASECRRFPPTVATREGPSESIHVYPSHLCGEWKPCDR